MARPISFTLAYWLDLAAWLRAEGIVATARSLDLFIPVWAERVLCRHFGIHGRSCRGRADHWALMRSGAPASRWLETGIAHTGRWHIVVPRIRIHRPPERLGSTAETLNGSTR